MYGELSSYIYNVNGVDVPVEIRPSKGYNIRMSYRDGKGRLSVPKGTSRQAFDHAVHNMNQWLSRLGRQKPHLFSFPETSPLFNDEITLVGQTYRLRIEPSTSTRTIRGRRRDGVLLIQAPPLIVNDREVLSGYLPKLFNRMFAKEIEARVHDINRETIRGRVGKVSLKSVISRWGSCTAANDIMLSNRLLLAPVHILDHVIVHELAHTIHKDHSIRFWRLVAQHDPEMKQHHDWLKKFGSKLRY